MVSYYLYICYLSELAVINFSASSSTKSSLSSLPNYDIFHPYGTHATMTQTDDSSPEEIELGEDYGNLRPSATPSSKGSSTTRRINLMFTDWTNY